MNRFVIVEGLPYLIDKGKTYTCRFDDNGFTLGAEVKLASVPEVWHSERAILAQCAGRLDSIQVTGSNYKTMTVAELKAYAADNDIDLGEASKKADIIAAIEAAEG